MTAPQIPSRSLTMSPSLCFHGINGNLDKLGDVHEQVCTSDFVLAPRMPLDLSDDPVAHREKIGQSVVSDNICVASPVGRAEKYKTATGIFLRMHNSLLTLNELCVPRVLEIL